MSWVPFTLIRNSSVKSFRPVGTGFVSVLLTGPTIPTVTIQKSNSPRHWQSPWRPKFWFSTHHLRLGRRRLSSSFGEHRCSKVPPRPRRGGGPGPVVTQKAKSFHGSAEVTASTAKMRLVQLAEEIISVLCSDANAAVHVTVEISADFPDGVSDQIKRAVTENASHLGFKAKTWE